MPTNPLAVWVASLSDTATVWEVAAALMGLAAIGFALWGAIDNVYDLGYVRQDGHPGGPRWITAVCLLAANVLFLFGWLGYTHVAVTAAYLPTRADISSATMNDVAVMRLAYGFFGLLGQVALRVMRTWLRNLPREKWAPLFGDAAKWEALYHQAQADAHTLRSEVFAQRAEKHQLAQRTTAAEGRLGLIVRWLQQQRIEVPPEILTPPKEPQL